MVDAHGRGSKRKRKRKPRPAPVSSEWTVRYAIGALVVVVVLAIPVGLVIEHVAGRGMLAAGIGGLAFDATMLATLVPLYRRRPFRRQAFGLRSAPPAASVGWVFLALILIGVTNLVWLHGVLGQKHPNPLPVTVQHGTAALVVFGLSAAVSAPITEEIFFRGLLYRALRNRLNVPLAAALAGALFALVHGLSYPLDTLPPRVVFGVLACLLYERTGSLLPGIALHCLIDGGGFESAVTGHNRIVFPAFTLLALALLIYAAVRSTRPDRPRPYVPGIQRRRAVARGTR